MANHQGNDVKKYRESNEDAKVSKVLCLPIGLPYKPTCDSCDHQESNGFGIALEDKVKVRKVEEHHKGNNADKWCASPSINTVLVVDIVSMNSGNTAENLDKACKE